MQSNDSGSFPSLFISFFWERTRSSRDELWLHRATATAAEVLLVASLRSSRQSKGALTLLCALYNSSPSSRDQQVLCTTLGRRHGYTDELSLCIADEHSRVICDPSAANHLIYECDESSWRSRQPKASVPFVSDLCNASRGRERCSCVENQTGRLDLCQHRVRKVTEMGFR